MTVSALGDAAISISAGERMDRETSWRANAIAAAIERERPAGVVDVVSAFGSVAVFYDFRTRVLDFGQARAELEAILQRVPEPSPAAPARRVELPVCYGGEFGPDLEYVAQRAGLAAEQVVALHAQASCWVDAIGFAPGFPYLGGLPETLATPRRATPRALVPAGSIGIGGSQTGVYPCATPGGWNLIGRTPRRLFDATQEVPAVLRAGDEVVFRSIDAAEFAREAQEQSAAEEPLAPERAAGATAGLRVLRAGMFTTVQDFGRLGHRASGVPASGAADSFALRVANLLVGNPPEAAALEFTLKGPMLQCSHDAVVALMGGDFGVPRGRPLRLRGGDALNLGAAASGCRGYLAVAGGIDVQPVLGSRSTYTRGRFGGSQGAALREGDWVPARLVPRQFSAHWHIDGRIAPDYSPRATVRVVAGAHADEFPADWAEAEFKVAVQSDRMGLRLDGPRVERRVAAELRSAPVTPGTIQIPPDGRPIVLLADAQTIGGYPRVAHVITVDLPIVAQLRPSDTVRFQLVSLEEAQALLVARERALARLREGLAQKLA